MMKLLVGYDGSVDADAAVEDLQLAGLPTQGEAVVVTVGNVLFTPPFASHEIVERSVSSVRAASTIELVQKQEAEKLREAQILTNHAVDRLTQLLSGWYVHPRILTGWPTKELLREAQFWNADLISVGTRGLSALGRFFFQSVSANVASDAFCAVRIGRKSSKDVDPTRARRIVVGVDGSSGASKAMRAVGRRIWPNHTEVLLVAVDDGTSSVRLQDTSSSLKELMIENNRSAFPINARPMAAAGQLALAARGLTVSIEILEGEPSRVLIETTREWEADCIFVGARGVTGGVERSGLGSVAAKLVTDAHCSVELVR